MTADRSTEEINATGTAPGVSQTVILVTAVLLLGVLCYAVLPLLSPFVLLGAILYLLYPLRRLAPARRLMWLSAALFALWFLYSILGILAPFIIAFLLAYALNPLVTTLEKRGIRRWVSSLVLILLLLAAVVGLFVFVMPIALQQFNTLLGGISAIVRELADLLNSGAVLQELARYGVPIEKVKEIITEQITPRLESVLTSLLEGVFGLLSGISSVALHIINIVIIPFLAFYMLMDYPVMLGRLSRFIPASRRDRAAGIAGKIDTLMGRYLRGAVLVALIQGVLSTAGLWFLGVPYALVLGIMTAFLDFIPYVGLLTSLSVASIVALFSDGPVAVRVTGVVVLFLSQKLLEATVLGPKIIGSQVGVHPVLLILCLLVFGYFLGFVGLLVAVPATALLVAGLNAWDERRAAESALPGTEP